jgi:hypothetical protein
MDVNAQNVADVDATKPIEEQLEPLYDNGKLTRAGMERVIKEGGSVLDGHRLYTTTESLPSEAALAKGDPGKEAAAMAKLQEQMAEIQRQMHELGGSRDERDLPFVTTSPVPPGGGIVAGTLGEGDTAGLDGDRSDPNTAAGKKAQAEAEAEAKARAEAEKEAKKAEAEAAKKAEGK